MKTCVVRCLIYSVSFLATWHGAATAKSGEDPLERRFLNEGPQGWAAIASAYSKLDATGVITDTATGTLDTGNKAEGQAFRYAVDSPGYYLYTSEGLEHQRKFVTCVNPKYGFGLTSSADANKFVVKYYGPERKSLEEDITAKMDRYTMAPYSSNAVDYSMILKDPGFKIHKVAELSGAEGLVRVDFELLTGRPDWPKIPEGWAVFDPKHSWAIREADAIIANAIPYHRMTKLVYDFGGGGPIPTLKSVEYVSYSKSPEDGANINRCVFNQFKLSPPPAGDFKMTAFGMPELADVPGEVAAGNHLERWLIGLGVALGAGAIFLKLRSGRRSA